jgi:hypothetical protein
LSTRLAAVPPPGTEVGDQQPARSGPGAQTALEAEPAVDHRAWCRLQRVDDLLIARCQRLFRHGEQLEESPDVRHPLGHYRPGGLKHQMADRRRHLRKVGGGVEALVANETLTQCGPIRGRSPAGEDEVRQRAEGEDVEPDSVGMGLKDPFRRLERLGLPSFALIDVRTLRRIEAADSGSRGFGRAEQGGQPVMVVPPSAPDAEGPTVPAIRQPPTSTRTPPSGRWRTKTAFGVSPRCTTRLLWA